MPVQLLAYLRLARLTDTALLAKVCSYKNALLQMSGVHRCQHTCELLTSGCGCLLMKQLQMCMCTRDAARFCNLLGDSRDGQALVCFLHIVKAGRSIVTALNTIF